MDGNQAVRRIVRRHAALLVLAVLAALSIVVVLHRGAVPLYEAAARVSMSPEAIRFSTEAEAVMARTRGLATSRSATVAAIEETGVRRSAQQLSERITVAALGTSTIISITVQDEDPEVAAQLADTIADRVVALYDKSSHARLAVATRRADEQAAVLDTRRRAAEQLSVVGDLNTATAAAQQLTQLNREAEALDAMRRELALAALLRPASEVLDRAPVPTEPVPSSLPQDAVLAVFVGLLAGCGGAAGREALRPTLVGSRAIARALEAPLLADLGRGVGAATATQLALLAAELQVAVRRLGLAHVLVLPAEAGVTTQAEALAERLRGCADRQLRAAAAPTEQPPVRGRDVDGTHALPATSELQHSPAMSLLGSVDLLEFRREMLVGAASGGSVCGITLFPQGPALESTRVLDESAPSQPPTGAVPPRPPSAPAETQLDVQSFDLRSLTAAAGTEAGVGLIVLSRQTLRMSQLDEIEDVIATTGWPVLGLVGCRTSRRRLGRRAHS